MKILIVDDDEFALDVLVHALVQAGHEPVAVSSGREALEILRKGAYRLVISDWIMPEMDGVELCRRIRAESFDAYVYVILLTSRSTPEDLVEGMSAGADDFIAKPFDPTELQVRVLAGERILSLETRTTVAEAANRAKNEFLAGMSHEIRTPMTAILGFAELLDEPASSPDETHELVTQIRQNGKRLISLLDNILDLSRLESGDVQCARDLYDPRQVVIQVASRVRARAEKAGLTFTIDCGGDIPAFVWGDPARVGQILFHLIDNAIKFTNEGRVRMTVRWSDQDRGDPRLCFEVADTGIGMTEDQAARVFRTCTQGDSSLSRRYGGMGLGLRICNRLAELMGGDVRIIETRPGVGTRVCAIIGTGHADAGAAVQGDGGPAAVHPVFPENSVLADRTGS
jgi:signal transduction histidine kinase